MDCTGRAIVVAEEIPVMALRIDTKARIGFSIAVIALATVVGVSAVKLLAIGHPLVVTVALVTALIGVAVWLIGQLRSKRANARTAGAANQRVLGAAFAFLRVPTYWGAILCLVSFTVGGYSAFELLREWLNRPVSVKAVPVIEQSVVEEPIRPLPRLAVTGIVVDGSNSTAVINGRVIEIGEWIEGVQLVDVQTDGISVVWQGRTNDVPIDP